MSNNPGMKGEPTSWSPGLLWFYASCTAVGIGAAVAAVMLVVFPETPFAVPGAVVGVVMTVGGCVGALLGLKSARNER